MQKEKLQIRSDADQFQDRFVFLLILAPNDQKDATKKKKTLKRISHIQFAFLFSSKICSEGKLPKLYIRNRSLPDLWLF